MIDLARKPKLANQPADTKPMFVDRTLTIVVLAFFLGAAAWCTVSPGSARYSVGAFGLEQYVPEMILASIEQNRSTLISAGRHRFAETTYANMVILFYLILVFAVVFFIYFFKRIDIIKYKKINNISIIIFIVIETYIYFYLFFSNDVYGASDGDFSGILRPPIASFIVSFGGASISLFLGFMPIFVLIRTFMRWR